MRPCIHHHYHAPFVKVLPVGLMVSPGVVLAAAKTPAPILNSSNVLETVGGLMIVLAVLLGLAWLVKRYMTAPGISKGRIQVVGGVSLGPRERAVIVEVEGERLLLGVAQGHVSMLHQLHDDTAVAGEFSQALVHAREQQETDR